MNSTQMLDIMYQTFQLVLKLALPPLLVSMVVGVTVAIFQATMQTSRQTMSFVPKLLSTLAMIGVLGSSVLALLQDSTRQILSMIAGGQLYIFILFSLAITRISGTIILNPIFGRTNVPFRVEAASILAISLMLYIDPRGIPVHESAVITECGAMSVKELLLGFTLGFGMELALLAVRLASAIMDYPMGLTITQVYDPQYNAQVTITIGMYHVFIAMLFLATNGHSQLLTIFFISCELISFGTTIFRSELAQAILLMFRESITMGSQFALPLTAVGLVVETAVGVLMRMISQINVFVVNFQIKVIAGIPMPLFLFSPMSNKLYMILNGIYQSLQQIVTLMRQEAGRK